MVAVEALGLHAAWQARKHDDGSRRRGDPRGLRKERVACLAGDGVVSGRVGDPALSRLLAEGAKEGVETRRRDKGTPGALIPRTLGEGPDDRDGDVGPEGEEAVVREEDRSRCRGAAREGVVRGEVGRGSGRGSRRARGGGAKREFDDALAREVERSHLERPDVERRGDLGVPRRGAPGHLQIAATLSDVANQSVIARPSNPHSSRRIAVRSSWLASQCVPLTLL